jgi:hypothetical protein
MAIKIQLGGVKATVRGDTYTGATVPPPAPAPKSKGKK